MQGFSQLAEEQTQFKMLMYQTEMLSQGRAAQRYASVDKEDNHSHVSLSSCTNHSGEAGRGG